jgi:hypothetical protein
MALFGGHGRVGHAVAVLVLACSLPAGPAPGAAQAMDRGPADSARPHREGDVAALLSAPTPRPRSAGFDDPVVVAGPDDPVLVGAAASAAATDIPPAALVAYQRASQVLLATDPSCRIPWSLLAAIGAVESGHGRAARSGHAAGGRVVPDTDHGSLDGSAARDRPLGPFRLLPDVWRAVAVDGDGDGLRRAQDIDDAAVAMAARLCDVTRALEQQSQVRRALDVLGANRGYITAVLGVQARYAAAATETAWPGAVQVAATPTAGTTVTRHDGKPVRRTRPASGTRTGPADASHPGPIAASGLITASGPDPAEEATAAAAEPAGPAAPPDPVQTDPADQGQATAAPTSEGDGTDQQPPSGTDASDTSTEPTEPETAQEPPQGGTEPDDSCSVDASAPPEEETNPGDALPAEEAAAVDPTDPAADPEEPTTVECSPPPCDAQQGEPTSEDAQKPEPVTSESCPPDAAMPPEDEASEPPPAGPSPTGR